MSRVSDLGFIPPQLPTLTEQPPEGSAWIHEVKYDGFRTLLVIGSKRARAFTRNGLDWTHRYPGIVAASAAFRSAILDGEVIVQDERGASDSAVPLLTGFGTGSTSSEPFPRRRPLRLDRCYPHVHQFSLTRNPSPGARTLNGTPTAARAKLAVAPPTKEIRWNKVAPRAGCLDIRPSASRRLIPVRKRTCLSSC